MDLNDLKVFTDNLQSEIRLFGEDIVFEKLRLLEARGWYYGNVVTPFFTRLSRERRFRDAQALYDQAFAAGLYRWTPEMEHQRRANIARKLPSICLVTLPKTGSIYLQRAIAHSLSLPAFQLTLSRFPNDYLLPGALRVFAEGGLVAQSHLDARAENLDLLYEAGVRRIHVHVRDPRQATVSWAVWMMSEIRGEAAHKRYLTDPFQPADIDQETEAWRMEWYAGNHYPACIRWIQQWVNAAERDTRLSINMTDHAQLQADRVGTLRAILQPFGCAAETITEHSFAPPEAGKSHYRQGSNEEWRTRLPAHVQEWMNEMLPPRLKARFGWPDS